VARKIYPAYICANPSSKLPQDFIAAIVTVGVIDVFKVIDVHHKEGYGLCRSSILDQRT
jgi:hypothetical protein